MSVINFSITEIDEMQASVKSFYNRNSSKSYLRYTQAVIKESQFGSKDENVLIDSVIDRCFWYMFVSNQIAYALQYRENPDLFNDFNNNFEFKSFGKLNPIELLKKLKSLNYNCTTNDGNVFAEAVYYEFFERIIHDLEQHLLDPILYPRVEAGYNID